MLLLKFFKRALANNSTLPDFSENIKYH